jgi:hypothetical protein
MYANKEHWRSFRIAPNLIGSSNVRFPPIAAITAKPFSYTPPRA